MKKIFYFLFISICSYSCSSDKDNLLFKECLENHLGIYVEESDVVSEDLGYCFLVGSKQNKGYNLLFVKDYLYVGHEIRLYRFPKEIDKSPLKALIIDLLEKKSTSNVWINSIMLYEFTLNGEIGIVYEDFSSKTELYEKKYFYDSKKGIWIEKV